MRVLLSPGAEVTSHGPEWAAALAGADEEVVGLGAFGVRTLRRALSQAEIHALRTALLGLSPGDRLEPPGPAESPETRTLGYVCVGRAVVAAPDVTPGGVGRDRGAEAVGTPGPPSLLAVADHVNLTWRSPLTGPNDDRLGPRFPVVAGLYRPEVVVAYWESPVRGASTPLPGDEDPWRWSPVAAGVVAEVEDEDRLSSFERSVVERHGIPVVCSELAAVAILAAHLGLKLAAGVVVV